MEREFGRNDEPLAADAPPIRRPSIGGNAAPHNSAQIGIIQEPGVGFKEAK